MKATSSSPVKCSKIVFSDVKFRAKFKERSTKIILSVVCESLEIRLLYRKLSSRKRRNSTEFLLNTATIRKAKLNCI